jgi:two-component system, chemotaxis family, CheB/CheR fusion protein
MTTKKNNSKSTSTKLLPASRSQFPIVAIGASAGGLEAMMDLLSDLPDEPGMAFIYVQHLSPDHKSMLAEIFSKKTKMQVQEIGDMDEIKSNHIFIIPYNKGIEVRNGRLKLISRSETTPTNSIDVLFSSLAFAEKDRVIGIVLSGSATDGTAGILDIKQEGGITFAQDNTAKFTSMPQSAIASGGVDFVLPPKEIALELVRISKHPYVKSNISKTNDEDLIESSDPDLKIILNQLHKTTGVDFSFYKMNTIKRRIIRRMLLYKITTLKQYAKLLTQKNEETDILYQDLLINVTSFFRDANTYSYLKENLFPRLLKSKKPGESLRIWVPACATGEEAYSIAMILLEIQEGKTATLPVQIFATDLSGSAINKARNGVYTKKELETVSPHRIRRFFTKAEGSFRVNKAVRDICVFAQHNILSDPPFSRLDFISCCNLFIYLETTAQKKAINTFHYALNPGGFLMLGKSENLSHSANLFASFNSKYKIFSPITNTGSNQLPSLSPGFPQQPVFEKNIPAANRNKIVKNATYDPQGLDNAIDAVLVSEFMPAGVVINHQLEILQFRGSTELFLTHPKGKATFNILKMARPEIAFELRRTISKVIKTKRRIRKTGIEVNTGKSKGDIKIISLDIVPLTIEWDEPLLLIVFSEQEQTDFHSPGESNRKNSSVKDRKIERLEKELAALHADMLSLSQEHEAFTEELQSANEEVVSSNEELQTLNEELETSREEIESANEELITTNQELQIRHDLLTEAQEFSDAIVSTMHEAMLVLNEDLRIKSANKAFYNTFGVSQEQTDGVYLYELGNKQWNIPELRELLEDIIPKNAQFFNYEVRLTLPHSGEKIMLLNASRILQKPHQEQLILLVIADITEVRRLVIEKELREKELLEKEIVKRKSEKRRLEKAVDTGTQELKEAYELLKNKNKELQNMNKELEAFAYVSSHDMQEPLRKLQTFAGIILEKENNNLSENGKKYFNLMQQSAGRMQQLVKDLLAFSRINAAERSFENMDLNIIVEEVREDFKEEIARKKAVIEVQKMCEARIIPFQFRQLMRNLIGNALKFSNPQTPPVIKIRSRKIKCKAQIIKGLIPQKEYCHISIADNGIGFEEEFKTRIFEVFQKLHTKEEYPGSGVGLAIVKKIVDNHNGVITATGELNKGATFNVYIPS